MSRPGREELTSWGVAWLGLWTALAVHIADEALSDFLAVYNPTAEALRLEHAWLWLPTFSFRLWMGLLVLALTGLLAVTPLVFLGKGAMRPVSLVFAFLMILNGVGHLMAVVYDPRFAAGSYSSPLLLVAAVYLCLRTPGRGSWRSGQGCGFS